MFSPTEADYDFAALTKALDRVKSTVFLGNNAAFFAPLMCSLNHIWSDACDTAGTNGEVLVWSPKFFLEAPIKYKEPTFNQFVIRHELWHVARLHMLRQDTRDPDYWNYACDIRINNDEYYAWKASGKSGYPWGTFPAWFNPSYDVNGTFASEEEIYKDLVAKKVPIPPNPWGNADIIASDDTRQGTINNVVRAAQTARMNGAPGDIPGDTKLQLDKFLAPIVPWEIHMKDWFTDLISVDYSWSRRNRRYPDIYLPGVVTDEGRLVHLMYFQDVSGSITDADILRFNSELKFIWETFKPKKMTIAQFDTRITKIDVLNEGDPFDKVFIVGRGGTDLNPVRDMIIEEKPTAVVIFSDLQVTPMQALPTPVPILWVGVNARGASVPFGKLIHIKT